MEFLELTGLGFNARYGSGQFSVLWVVRIGNHLHGGNNVNRNVNRGTSGGGVRYVCTVDQRSALRGARAFQIDAAVGPSNDARNQRQRAFEAVVRIGSSFKHLVVYGC